MIPQDLNLHFKYFYTQNFVIHGAIELWKIDMNTLHEDEFNLFLKFFLFFIFYFSIYFIFCMSFLCFFVWILCLFFLYKYQQGQSKN
jgi:hypothetical protein